MCPIKHAVSLHKLGERALAPLKLGLPLKTPGLQKGSSLCNALMKVKTRTAGQVWLF